MNIVVVSPHPDDETLGAGGTLLRYKREGHKIFWINVTDVQENQGWDIEFIERRKTQIDNICKFYGFEGFYNLKFMPAKLESIDKDLIIKRISECFQEIQPEWIILPDGNDAHSDHKIVFESCMACSKIFRYPYIKKITTMEIVSETDFGNMDHPFSPNYFVDISDYMNDKIKATKIYDTELKEPPFPRSVEVIKALGTIRGGMSGVRYAEAYRMIKCID